MRFEPLNPSRGLGWFLDTASDAIVAMFRNSTKATLTSAGALSTASVAATGAVSGASVAATGAVTGASVTATGTVAGAAIDAGADTALVKTAKVTLTAAQIKALAASPITLVAAVASKYHQFLGAALKLNAGSETLAEPSAPDDLEVKLKDGSGTTVSTTADAGAIIVGTADAYATMAPVEVEGGLLAARVNVPLVIHNTGGEYTGNASNDATLEITVAYIEHDVS
jgi:hypothetical protein